MLYEIEVVQRYYDDDAYYGTWVVDGPDSEHNGRYNAVPLAVTLYALQRAAEVGMGSLEAYVTISDFAPGTVSPTGETTPAVVYRLGVLGWDNRDEYAALVNKVQGALRAGQTHD